MMATHSNQQLLYGNYNNAEYFMDENVETIERKTDTILDAFSAVGGLMGFVTFFCAFIT